MGQYLAIDLAHALLSVSRHTGILHGSWEIALHQLSPELGTEKIARMMMKIIKIRAPSLLDV